MAEYIDREALLRFVGRQPTIAPTTAREDRLINAIIRTIEMYPAADVRENVRGDWKEQWSGNGWNEWVDCTCSVCGTEFERFEINANFCPNCGADMRGGNDG